jgi:hypothetical protein
MQETNALETRNTGFFGSLFGGLKELAVGVAPVAADIYTLRLKDQELRNSYAGTAAQLQREQEAAAAAGAARGSGITPAQKRLLIWGGSALATVAVLAFLFNRRR